MCSAKQLPNAVTFISGVMNGSGGSHPSRMKSSTAFSDRMFATLGQKLVSPPRNHAGAAALTFRPAIPISAVTEQPYAGSSTRECLRIPDGAPCVVPTTHLLRGAVPHVADPSHRLPGVRGRASHRVHHHDRSIRDDAREHALRAGRRDPSDRA